MEAKVLLLSAQNLKDIHYKIDYPEALGRAHVKYVLSKGAFMSKTVASVFEKVGITMAFYFSYSRRKYNCWLKLLATGRKLT